MPFAALHRAALVAAVLPALAAAEVETTHRLQVPEHGVLELALPAAWRSSTEDAVASAPDEHGNVAPPQGETLRIEPAQGTKFLLMATPAWVPASDRDAKKAVGWMKTRLLNQTVEGDPVVEEFKGSKNVVYWFRATNRDPLPGEKDRMIQGAAVVGELLVGFTLLYHPGDLPERDVVLKALGGARHVGSKP
jgi:hypothetical protein